MRRVRSAPPPPPPENVGIQPAPEQQKEAIALLRQMNDARSTKSTKKEQVLPVGGEQPMPSAEGVGEEKLPDASGGELGTEEYLPVPEETEEPVPYEETPELQAGSLRDPQTSRASGEEKRVTPRSIDPAKQHGLRSPALPKMLPMDMDGKLNSGI